MITAILELAKENKVNIDIRFKADGTTIDIYITGSGVVSCKQVKIYELQSSLVDVIKQVIESHKNSEGWDILKALKMSSEKKGVEIK